MKPAILVTLLLALILSQVSFAQQASTARAPLPARFKTYDKTKNYTVIKFWNEKDAPTDGEQKKETENLSKQLAKKGVSMKVYSYTTKDDIARALEANGISDVDVSIDNGISIKGNKQSGEQTKVKNVSNSQWSYNTDQKKAIFVFEGKQGSEAMHPVMLTTGNYNNGFLKTFFGIRATN